MWNLTKIIIAAIVLAIVTSVANRFPRIGALVLSLPIVSILAFILTWQQAHDLAAISKLARETIVLVMLGLPLFLPLAFAVRLGLSFWPALGVGLVLAAALIGTWLAFGPQT